MFLSKTGKSDAIDSLKRRSKGTMSVLESNMIADNTKKVSRKRLAINKQWLMSLESELRDAIKDYPELLASFQENLFSLWAKANYCCQYTLAHVHIFKLCDVKDVSKDVASLIETVVKNSYKRYTLETGESVHLIRGMFASDANDEE